MKQKRKKRRQVDKAKEEECRNYLWNSFFKIDHFIKQTKKTSLNLEFYNHRWNFWMHPGKAKRKRKISGLLLEDELQREHQKVLTIQNMMVHLKALLGNSQEQLYFQDSLIENQLIIDEEHLAADYNDDLSIADQDYSRRAFKWTIIFCIVSTF